MNEQINPEPNAQNSNPEEKNKISTILGVIIILIFAGTIVFFLIKFQESKEISVTSETPVKIQTDDTSKKVEEPKAEDSTVIPATGSTVPATQSTVNIDYEISQLDSQINSVGDNDFQEGELSNANLGI